MNPPRTLNIPQPPNYLQMPAFERRRVVTREGNDVTITVPEGVNFDLRGLR